jgi:hypothetical protein
MPQNLEKWFTCVPQTLENVIPSSWASKGEHVHFYQIAFSCLRIYGEINMFLPAFRKRSLAGSPVTETGQVMVTRAVTPRTRSIYEMTFAPSDIVIVTDNLICERNCHDGVLQLHSGMRACPISNKQICHEVLVTFSRSYICCAYNRTPRRESRNFGGIGAHLCPCSRGLFPIVL